MFVNMVELLIDTCKRFLAAERRGDMLTVGTMGDHIIAMTNVLTAGLDQNEVDRAKAYTVYMTGGGAYDADGNPFVTPAEAEQSLRLLLEAAWQDSN